MAFVIVMAITSIFALLVMIWAEIDSRHISQTE